MSVRHDVFAVLLGFDKIGVSSTLSEINRGPEFDPVVYLMCYDQWCG